MILKIYSKQEIIGRRVTPLRPQLNLNPDINKRTKGLWKSLVDKPIFQTDWKCIFRIDLMCQA